MSRLQLGTTVDCADGPLGELTDVVIECSWRRVTHLVVGGRNLAGGGRLVPIELADEGDAGPIGLRCTVAEALELPRVQELAFLRLGELPAEDPDWDVGVTDVVPMPDSDAGAGVGYPPEPGLDSVMMYDRVPKGEAEIRRASTVITCDGHEAGHVDGFLLHECSITHMALRHGHLWSKRLLTIPVEAIAEVRTDTVTLHLSKDEVKALR